MSDHIDEAEFVANLKKKLTAAAQSSRVQAVNKKSDTKDEVEKLAAKKQAAEIESIEQNNKNLEANRKLRWKYASWVFGYLVVYSAVVLLLLIFSGFGCLGFSLPESVLGFLVGSTAVSAIGLVLAVTHGLFK